MSNWFFERPVLNSPYSESTRHWGLDQSGQPTQRIIDSRRRAEFITPIAKPKRRKGTAEQSTLVFDEGKGLSTDRQQYAHTAIINGVREQVDEWRRIPNSNDWRVTPETARVLQHWRHHAFSSIRPRPWGTLRGTHYGGELRIPRKPLCFSRDLHPTRAYQNNFNKIRLFLDLCANYHMSISSAACQLCREAP